MRTVDEVVDPHHCGQPMLRCYQQRSREDRYDLALLIETVNAIYGCMTCGAKLSVRLEQAVVLTDPSATS